MSRIEKKLKKSGRAGWKPGARRGDGVGGRNRSRRIYSRTRGDEPRTWERRRREALAPRTEDWGA